MGICPNAYYNYLKKRKAEYLANKSEIYREIESLYHETGGILGYRSMKIFLLRKGISLSKTTVHRYMNQDLRLLCICRRKRPEYKKGHQHKVFPNILNQNFAVAAKNKVWCTDFTYLFLSNGTVRYNCTIIDLYDRSVVASETGKWMTNELAIKTLKKALAAQQTRPIGLLLHSDQGTQFTSLNFVRCCEKNGIQQSMSRAGCPYDNAPMERYYNSLKAELIDRFYFHTDQDLISAVAEYAYLWYNQIRPHSYNNYLTPLEVRNSSG